MGGLFSSKGGAAALERVKLSVHRVVDWVLRCGDLDSRYVDASTMQQGAAAHRKTKKP